MREIKFRQWCSRDKRFHYWGYLESGSEFFESPLGYISKDNPRKSQQFTGLLDEQGKEIYELDLVKVSDLPDEDFNGVFKVIWDASMFRLVRETSLGRHFIPMNYTMEVIGNVFEAQNF